VTDRASPSVRHRRRSVRHRRRSVRHSVRHRPSARIRRRRTVLGAPVPAARVRGLFRFRAGRRRNEYLRSGTLDELAARFAPTLFFDAAEPWFPTDPRPYTVEEDGETVVDGFVAFDGYHERYDEADEPPNPTVFYNGVQYEDSPRGRPVLALLRVRPVHGQLPLARLGSAPRLRRPRHGRSPTVRRQFALSAACRTTSFSTRTPTPVPRILSELGSHSSTLSVNENPASSNASARRVARGHHEHDDRHGRGPPSGFPSRTGSPRRGCGSRSSFRSTRANALRSPGPLVGHGRLAGRRRAHDSVARRVGIAPDRPSVPRDGNRLPAPRARPTTATGLDGRRRPPTRSPSRSSGTTSSRARSWRRISAFTGPQLSYEFAVPEIVEDAVASHITTTGIPWKQPRYQNPALDITAGTTGLSSPDRYDAIAAEESFGDGDGRTRRGRRPRHAGGRERRRPRRRGVDDDRRGHRVVRPDRERSGSGPPRSAAGSRSRTGSPTATTG